MQDYATGDKMSLIPEGERKELEMFLERKLEKKVKIIFFKGNTPECQYCSRIEELLKEISSLNEMIEYEVFDFKSSKAKMYKVKSAPVLLFEQKPNVRYLGIPSGHEFSAFMEDIIRISRNEIDLKLSTVQKIMKIRKPVHIMVFVTPTCPYCPLAVKTAHMFAMANENILAEMIEAIEYKRLAEKWNVMAVPKIVINEKIEFEGAYPEEIFADYVLKAVE